MATRSTPTGVLVTLVLFVILSIGLAVLSVFSYFEYKEKEAQCRKIQDRLDKVATAADLQSEELKSLQGGAETANRSLVAYLVDLNRQLSGHLTGDRSRVIDDKVLAKVVKDYGVPEGGSLNGYIADLRKSHELETSRNDTLQKQIKVLQDQFEAASKAAKGGEAGSEALASATQQLEALKATADAYRAGADALAKAQSESRQEFERRVSEVQDERNNTVEGLKATTATLQTQLDQAHKKLSQFDVGLQNPALAVDGHVIEVNGADGQVFIDLGKPQRLQAGTTFEVFESPEQIRSSGEQGNRGKATLQVMRVGDVTSIARVIRHSAARPVVRGDLIANAVYSPSHQYRFLVHGLFSIDGDGLPSAAETDLVVQRIKDWGGLVSSEDRVTGDLDFVVLGEPPRDPPALSPTASAAEVADYQRAKATKNQYEQILGDATRARIPVLNWNRFQALTGMSTD